MTGTVELPEGTEMVMPGDNLKFTVELIAPIAMEEETALRHPRRRPHRRRGRGVEDHQGLKDVEINRFEWGHAAPTSQPAAKDKKCSRKNSHPA